jgi:hypothetical protein
MTCRLLAACALAALVPAVAEAQARRPPARPPGPKRIEVGIGGGIAGGLVLGERDATLRSNAASASPFRLFTADTRLDPSPLLEVRLGYRLTPRLVVEGTLGLSRPELVSSLSGDAENATAVEARSTLTEYLVTGGASWRLSTNTRRRWTPFVSGGAGVLRHVHDGQSLIESGVDGYAGGGLLYRLGSPRGVDPRAGLRLDARLHVVSGGLAEGAGTTPRGVLTGSIFVTF